MGHHAGSNGTRGEQAGSAVGMRYRHLTPQMQARMLAVIERCLATALSRMPSDGAGQPG